MTHNSNSLVKLLKNTMNVAFATIISRILGFIRVILEARILGGEVLASAWFLAFMIPNSLRRILGEGAMGSVIVPLLSEDNSKNNIRTVRIKIAKILLSVAWILTAITLLVITAVFSLKFNLESISDKNRILFEILPIIMPYSIFICLCGIIGSILNLKKVFFLPALGALSLNVFLISSLLIIPNFCKNNQILIVKLLAFMVVSSGIVQLYYFFIIMAKNNCLPLFKFSEFKNHHFFKEFWKMFLPALLGTSALQIGLIIDKSLAYSISEQALPSLTYSDRIIYLPIGVFAVAFGSVSLSYLSSYAAQNRYSEMVEALFYGLKSLFYICAPCVALIALLRNEIISLICLGGNFNISDLKETSFAIIFYVWGIPFFASLKILTAAFYSRKDMKTPLYISLVCIAVNIILNIILMFPLKQGGLALATTISSLLNNSLLIYFLNKHLKIEKKIFKNFILTIVKIILVNSIIITIIIAFIKFFDIKVELGNKLYEAFFISAIGVSFAVLYLFLSLIFKINEAKEVLKIFKKV
ncbi:murein biosynthesis integral membrane protein MurJ [Lentisphaerota bacterium WC36G]|nr:murein biosynthesis integral membrane protein MurJ [Lentisphaerae bacterium WC36]